MVKRVIWAITSVYQPSLPSLAKEVVLDSEMERKEIQDLLIYFRGQFDLQELEADRLFLAIEKEVRARALEKNWSLSQSSHILDLVYASIRGYDVLEEFFHDPEITEIMVNAYDKIFIEKKGELFETGRSFVDESRYFDIIQKMVADAGREVNQRNPICDFRLKDGSRVNIVLSPLASKNALTIRRFREKNFSLEDLVDMGSISQESMQFFRALVQAKYNIFICGGTGSGKTTFLNALSMEIDGKERLITIEDARELSFDDKENWVALETRMPNAQGIGQVTIRDLIRTSLRMRPDRIIVGEVRGEEAIDMLQALNTGHDGSFSTGHSNSVQDMQFRLETMILSNSQSLPLQAVRQQIASAIDFFVHLSRFPDRSRRMVSIEEVYWEDGNIAYNPIFVLDDQMQLTYTGKKLRNEEKFKRMGIENPLEELYA